ncbi:hypothetical protein TPY_1949 [Sulfobacillus acidophilus TPY]|uniref:YhfC family intramembrane metalloprotease n=1 Tax=Sulfobacillus acidophilus (strain ATCC 700253 / DSM 10332 / NAL) TaxID=679936 RepID=G8TTG3_SULAD|nr:hypothetical protein TPY_1949 [Sulfobacillus acidophilus TPY]AEW05629.1 hypothetical protein Sulac_2146 [Sulfobacillus acidophilus DSM 10332]
MTNVGFFGLFVILNSGVALAVQGVGRVLLFGRTVQQKPYSAVPLGFAAFLVGIMGQSVLVHGYSLMTSTSVQFIPWIVLGMAAATGQTFAKYVAIRSGSSDLTADVAWLEGLSVGLGFSLAEILYLGITQFPGVLPPTILWSTVERLGATLFDLASGLWLVGFIKTRRIEMLGLVWAFHTSVDGVGAWVRQHEIYVPVFELSQALGALILFVIAIIYGRTWLKR